MEQIQLGMQGMPQEEFHDHFAGLNLGGQLAQGFLIGIGRRSDRQLLPKLFRQLDLQAQFGLVI